jgi:subtilase family serine protease
VDDVVGTSRRIGLSLLAGALVAPLLVTGTAQAAAPPDHVKTLTAVLDGMTANYAKYAKSTPGPQDVFDYGLGALWKKGIDGTGTSVAVVEGWDDPQIDDVVKAFDQKYGLPDPVIQTVYPTGGGHLPAVCPPGMVALGSYGSCDAWAGELELDVLSAHLVAPYAKIVIAAAPADSEITDDAASQVAPPEMMQAVEYLARNHLADAISISDGTGESTYSHGNPEILAQSPALLTAAAAGIPVTVSTGDCGVVQNLAVASSQCGNTTRTPATATWDDSPWVTAVGGSVPNFSAAGQRVGPDPLWHSGIFSEGAGYSSVFARPSYQDGVTTAAMRSVPDITMDGQQGTSEATPLFAGILALAAQLNHGSVGPIGKLLYGELGPRGTRAGIADVVAGDNSFSSGGTTVAGFTAGPGFDVASGWGTIDAAKFVPALVAAARAQNPFTSQQHQAADALAALNRGVSLANPVIGPGGSSSVTAGGFLPGHPVRLAVDGHQVSTLTADDQGSVACSLDPGALKLRLGVHTLTLTSMLLAAKAGFLTY